MPVDRLCDCGCGTVNPSARTERNHLSGKGPIRALVARTKNKTLKSLKKSFPLTFRHSKPNHSHSNSNADAVPPSDPISPSPNLVELEPENQNDDDQVGSQMMEVGEVGSVSGPDSSGDSDSEDDFGLESDSEGDIDGVDEVWQQGMHANDRLKEISSRNFAEIGASSGMFYLH